jgi:hypothetical protein
MEGAIHLLCAGRRRSSEARPTLTAETSRPRDPDAPRPLRQPPPERPGVREQFGRAKAAFGRLIGAHRALLMAELGEIVAQIKIIAVLAGILVGLGLLLVHLLYIGGWLFLGEWLFGSLGWGLLHGALFTIGVMTAVGLVLAGGPARAAVTGAVVAIVLTVLLSLLLASNVLRDTSEYAASQLALAVPLLDPVALPGALIGGVVVGVLLLISGLRAGGLRAAIPGLIGGFILGFIVGAILGGWRWQTHTAIAFSIAIGLLLWPVLSAILAMRSGIDTKKRFGHLYPKETVATVNETRGWLQQQWARQRKKLTSR